MGVEERVGVEDLGRLRPAVGGEMRGRGGGGAGRAMVEGELRLVQPPLPLVVISEGWPGCLATVLALGLPLAAGIFPIRWHRYFKLPLNNNSITPWESLEVMRPTKFDWGGDYIFIVAGSPDFLDRTIRRIGGGDRVMACCEMNFRDGRRVKRGTWRRGEKVLARHGLAQVHIRDAACRGATDCKHLFGFGRGVLDGAGRLPGVETHVSRRIRHYLDGGVRGRFELVGEDELAVLEEEERVLKVLQRGGPASLQLPRLCHRLSLLHSSGQASSSAVIGSGSV